VTANWESAADLDEYPGCLGCAHLRRGGRAHCVAYPDGIPFGIASGQVDHLVPRPGQVGDVVFTEVDFDHFRTTGERIPLRAPEPATPTG